MEKGKKTNNQKEGWKKEGKKQGDQNTGQRRRGGKEEKGDIYMRLPS